LQISDRIEVDLTGTPQPILPSEMDISDQGTIQIANIDHPIQAAGETPQELAEIIRTNLMPDIYIHVNVNVIPLKRYFYVSGEINQSGTGGRQEYLSRITVTGAITAAGGFNEFAWRHGVTVTRLDGSIHVVDCVKALTHPELDLEVFPGDRINVPKRTFWKAISGQ
jgi:protein involved in polysaccharide export with SLBB domain